MSSPQSQPSSKRCWQGQPPVEPKKTPTRWLLIPLVGTLIISAGCQAMPTRPPKPTLTIIPRSDGGICLDRNNAVLMGLYIQALEAGYE